MVAIMKERVDKKWNLAIKPQGLAKTGPPAGV